MRRFTIPLGIGLILLAGIIGYATRTGEVLKLRRQNVTLVQKNQQLQQSYTGERKDTAALFFMKNTGSNFVLVPVIEEFPSTNPEQKRMAVLEALFNGPPSDSQLLAIFPKGTKALSIKVENGLATIDLNQKATQLNVGSQGEALAVASLVNTLTKLPEIFEVKILVEGEEVESLAGHVDLSETFRYNSQFVSFD